MANGLMVTPAHLETLEAMVDAVGMRNMVYALASIAGAKAEHVAHAWQDSTTAKVWEADARLLDATAHKLRDPLAR